ncbi:MAG TPA: acyl-CoA dehydrogenase family protein [Woeseiaceae bacterium]|nr:acyl-CoA dehydrogenase family protein [Woeseiaceae bacterium]
MKHRNPRTRLGTHEVTNQASPFEDVNLYQADTALRETVQRAGAAPAAAACNALGERAGSAEVQQWAARANGNPPRLCAFDRFGRRLDEVEFHPDYHRLMALGLETRVSSIAWTSAQGGHAAHTALMYLLTQADAGVCCPFSMTYASVAALRHQPEVAEEWEPRITAAAYDGRSLPAAEKTGVTIGMAMTEKQGGSDVRANTTSAARTGTAGEYELTGHKWFCSAPMSDAFLTLARTGAGLSCFLMPRWRPDGTRNAIRIVRLKDKLGDRSNASAEIELDAAWGRLVGEEGHGVRTILDMVQGTRLDCLAGSAGLMRAALANAIHHCSERRAFGRELIRQEAMARVLADLALEQEAALALAFRVARAFDGAAQSDHEAALARILTPIAKYWVCKRAPGFIYEAMECLGGNGYVEESPLPRLFRQAPVNSIWEGSGNVIALDTLRAIGRQPVVLGALLAELDEARGFDERLDRKVLALKDSTGNLAEANARHFVESMALAFQAAILARTAPAVVAEAFVRARLGEDCGHTYGAFAGDIDTAALIERALPL